MNMHVHVYMYVSVYVSCICITCMVYAVCIDAMPGIVSRSLASVSTHHMKATDLRSGGTNAGATTYIALSLTL